MLMIPDPPLEKPAWMKTAENPGWKQETTVLSKIWGETCGSGENRGKSCAALSAFLRTPQESAADDAAQSAIIIHSFSSSSSFFFISHHYYHECNKDPCHQNSKLPSWIADYPAMSFLFVCWQIEISSAGQSTTSSWPSHYNLYILTIIIIAILFIDIRWTFLKQPQALFCKNHSSNRPSVAIVLPSKRLLVSIEVAPRFPFHRVHPSE